MRALILLIPTASGIMPLTAATAARPPVGNIANFIVKTDNLDEARRFYGDVLGYDEVFRHKRAVSGPAELSVFKVNERQYIEVSPTLENYRTSRVTGGQGGGNEVSSDAVSEEG